MHSSDSDISYHLQSYADSRGRLFLRDGKVMRHIDRGSSNFYSNFITSPLYRTLLSDGLLIESSARETNHDGSIIIEHQTIEHVSYPFEWSFNGLKASALMFLELQERLLREGLSIHDGHPFNVLFDGCRPVFVDLSSINAAQPRRWGASRQFRRNFLNPLRLMAAGHTKVPRAVMARGQGISDEETDLLTGRGGRLTRTLKQSFRNTRQKWQKNPASIVQRLRRSVEDLSYPKSATKWGNYYKEPEPVDLKNYSNLKQENVRKTIDKLKPRTILDAACNQGWFARLGSIHGARVIGFDLDEVAVNKAFDVCHDTGANVQPLVMDFANPSPALGILNQGFPNAIQRFRSEMVLALAIVHHLVFSANLRFEQIVFTLEAMTEKWLLIEFIPGEDIHVSKWKKPIPEWYNLENFKKVLGSSFESIEILESEPSPRVFLLCAKSAL